MGSAVVLLVGLLAFLWPLAVCAEKGKTGLAVAGLFVPGFWVFAFFGALGLAKPNSSWAARYYEPDGPMEVRARRRWPTLAT